MRVTNPCCISLQKGVKVLAIVDWIISVLMLIAYISQLLTGLGWASRNYYNDDNYGYLLDADAMEITLVILFGLIFLINLVRAVMLHRVAKYRYLGICRKWLITTAFNTAVFTVIYLSDMIYETNSDYADSLTMTLILVFGLVYTVYEMWVVSCFRCEILETRSTPCTTDAEMTTYPYRNGYYPRNDPPFAYYNSSAFTSPPMNDLPPAYSEVVPGARSSMETQTQL